MRKHLKARRERIRQIEQAEAKARCAYCKAPFTETGQKFESFLNARAFCSEWCLKAAEDYIRPVCR